VVGVDLVGGDLWAGFKLGRGGHGDGVVGLSGEALHCEAH
jgi:hypothetical protein